MADLGGTKKKTTIAPGTYAAPSLGTAVTQTAKQAAASTATSMPAVGKGAAASSPVGAMSNMPNVDIMASLQPLLSSMSAPRPAAAPAPPEITNTAATDPNLQDYLSRLKGRLDNPEGSTKRAIDVAGGAIRDVGEGEKSAVQANAARRGVLSSSTIPEIGEAAISKGVQSNVGKAAAGIALGRERDNDAFLAGSGGAFQAPGAAARADRSLGLNQWQVAQANQRAMEAAQMQQWMSSLDLIGNLLRL